MKLSKLLALLLACAMLFACTACDGEESNPQGTNNDNANNNSNISTNDNEQEKVTYQDSVNDAYADEKYGFQLDAPEEGETVAIMHTGMGDISIRFFPEAAPKAVENFLTHAKDGYYDGLTFHRIIDDFMIQGGDPEGTGAGGENIWGTKGFEDEFNKKLMNLRGSLAMANSGVNTNGSQFFINQAGPTGKSAEELAEQYNYESMVNQMAGTYDMYVQYYGESFTTYYPDLESFISANGGISPDSRLVPAEVWKLYAEIGGNIHLDGAWRQSGGHTVFGQVYDGMDVVDAIAMVETDKDGKPNKKVLIKSIDVITYSK